MSNRYCLPIIARTKADVLETLAAHERRYEFIEVWLDHIEDLDEEFVQRLIAQLPSKLVLVFRHQALEPMRMAARKRQSILRLLDGTPVLVDLDLASQRADLDFIKRHNLKIQSILSFHDYHGTPTDERLRQIVRRMMLNNPTIFKLATFCTSESDAARLLTLLLSLRSAGRRFIILGMGEHGVITRIFGTLWGNELTFAPDTLAGQSAPGQLTRAQLDSILRTLKG